ncbi:MAG: hypothetical protein Q7T97_02290 [Burkholderiaceae bacterium]|nr:hypothetical protein [Burkholderiaceae bacterium]
MSLVTQMIVAEKYGPRLTLDQLSHVLSISKGTIYNQISAATFPIPTYLDGGKRFADYRHVAEYLDACHQQAA